MAIRRRHSGSAERYNKKRGAQYCSICYTETAMECEYAKSSVRNGKKEFGG